MNKTTNKMNKMTNYANESCTLQHCTPDQASWLASFINETPGVIEGLLTQAAQARQLAWVGKVGVARQVCNPIADMFERQAVLRAAEAERFFHSRTQLHVDVAALFARYQRMSRSR
jgi:ubiquinone biosynthesis protein UbiJ